MSLKVLHFAELVVVIGALHKALIGPGLDVADVGHDGLG